jgi:hypothetical protein
VKYLVFCTCGHSLERHGPDGCTGPDVNPPLPCLCRFDQRDALESAISDARVHPWGKQPVAAAS